MRQLQHLQSAVWRDQPQENRDSGGPRSERRPEGHFRDEGPVHRAAGELQSRADLHHRRGVVAADGGGPLAAELVGNRGTRVTHRDLEVIKNDNGLFISHRDGVFDQYVVNETSADLPTEEENKNNCLW